MTRADTVGRIVRLGRVESTQGVAFALAAEGAADRTVVVADSQAAGRGRRGHTWIDEPGASLLVSIVLRPRLEMVRLPLLSLAAGVAVADALTAIAGLEPRLKWPNDVLVADKKIAGILLESRTAGGADVVTIIGIGINLGQREFPSDLASSATSVALETGQAPSREAVLAALREEFDAWRARLEGEGFGPVREAWRRLSDTIGRRVTVDTVTGVASDLDTDGALLIDVGGSVKRVLAGAVSSGDAVGAPVPSR